MKERANFADVNEAPQSHPLFSSEKNFGHLSLAKVHEKQDLRAKLNRFALIPGIQLQKVYRASWVSRYGTKFKSGAVVICDVAVELVKPIFGSVVQIWLINDYIYFQYMPLGTLYFDERFQAYHANSLEEAETKICSYESLVDFNVHHIHEDNERKKYV